MKDKIEYISLDDMINKHIESLTVEEIQAYIKEVDKRHLNSLYANRPEVLKHLRDDNEK